MKIKRSLFFILAISIILIMGSEAKSADRSSFELLAMGNPCTANPCASNPCAANPCAVNPCAANPCAANPCGANPCGANPCAVNPCGANPCGANPCAVNPCWVNPCGANPCTGDPSAAGSGKPVRMNNITDIAALNAEGERLWKDTSLSSLGISCASCHPNGLGLYRAPYPKYLKMPNDILTLDQMINFCMENPMKSKPLEWNSREMTALAAYVTVNASGVANPCMANPCAANPCGGNPCASNPCGVNPCGANPCAVNPCAANPCGGS